MRSPTAVTQALADPSTRSSGKDKSQTIVLSSSKSVKNKKKFTCLFQNAKLLSSSEVLPLGQAM